MCKEKRKRIRTNKKLKCSFSNVIFLKFNFNPNSSHSIYIQFISFQSVPVQADCVPRKTYLPFFQSYSGSTASLELITLMHVTGTRIFEFEKKIEFQKVRENKTESTVLLHGSRAATASAPLNCFFASTLAWIPTQKEVERAEPKENEFSALPVASLLPCHLNQILADQRFPIFLSCQSWRGYCLLLQIWLPSGSNEYENNSFPSFSVAIIRTIYIDPEAEYEEWKC